MAEARVTKQTSRKPLRAALSYTSARCQKLDRSLPPSAPDSTRQHQCAASPLPLARARVRDEGVTFATFHGQIDCPMHTIRSP